MRWFLERIDIHRRVVHIISIIGVCPIDIHRTSEGCLRLKTNTFVWKWFSFIKKCMFKGVSENSRRMGVKDPRYHSSVWL